MAAGVPSHEAEELSVPSARLPAWLRPAPITVTVMIFTVLLAYYMTPTSYLTNYREPKYVNASTVGWVVLLTVAFCIPAVVIAGERLRSQPSRSWEFSPAEHRTLRRLVIFFFILTMAGYVVWFIHAAGNGFHFGAVSKQLSGTSGQANTNKDQLTTISGITTMTQFGIPVIVIALLVWPKTTKGVKVMAGIVFAIGLYRTLAASERLAIYELGLPIVAIIAARFYTAAGRPLEVRRRRLMVRAVPLVAVPLLILSFAGFEYTRSWSYYRHHTHDTFLPYETKRLAGYYVTAYNNAQVLHTYHLWPEPGGLPWMTWQGVWKFPIFKSLVSYEKLTGTNYFVAYDDALGRYANREFNNYGGLTDATFDYGPIGGPIFVAIVGAIVGGAYASFAQRRRVGLLFYPMLLVFLVELPREWYITSGRAIPALAGALLAACALRRVRHREHRRAALLSAPKGTVGLERQQTLAPAGGANRPTV